MTGNIIDGDGCNEFCQIEPQCTASGECNDNNICTQDQCISQMCQFTPNIYGDLNRDGIVDLFDIFCVLDGFQNIFNDCSFEDVDIFPCPSGDGVIDVFDTFAF